MKRISAILIILFSFCVPKYLSAQNKEHTSIDSLLKILPTLKVDSNRFFVLNELSSDYNSINSDEGIKYGMQCLQLAEQLKIQKHICSALNSIGTNYLSKADYPKALEYYFKAIKYSDENNINNELVATILGNIGTVYLYQTNYDKALEYYFKAIPIYQQTGKNIGLANTLNGIGTVYGFQRNYEKSKEFYTKAIAIDEEVGNSIGVAEIFVNIGDNYKDQAKYTEALAYYNKALNLYELLGNKDGIGTGLGYIGKCYLTIAKDTETQIQTDSFISSDKKANIQKAILNLDNGIKLSREAGDITNLIDFSLALSDAYRLSGNYISAFENLKLYINLKDSVFSEKNNQKIAGLETQREHELKAKVDAFEKLQKRNERLTILAAFIAMFIIIFIIVNNNKSQKKSNRLLAVEKQKSDNLLLNILPSEVAEELKETGNAEAKYFDNVTVMFTDFVGFTKVVNIMSPQELVAELHTCFKAFDEIIAKYNIEKIKTIGDAYMAISGLPQPNPNHALDIVNAAIDIKRFMYERRQLLGDKTFELRIGIHSGNVVAGIVGVKKFAYDIWGDTVNTAARMEQNSAPGKINISEAVYQLVKHKIECTYRGEIEAKNKGMLRMYFVVA